MNILPEISITAPYRNELSCSRASQGLVACAMLRSGYSIGQIAGLLHGIDEGGLPSILHRMLSSTATESWLRTNLILHEKEILAEVKHLLGEPTGKAHATNDELLARFNTTAMTLSGKEVGKAPDAEIKLLEIVDLNFGKICMFLSDPLCREGVQASLWLRDLASFPRVLPTMSRRSQAARLIKLRLKLALPPRRQGSALLSMPLFMDSQPSY